MISGPITKLRDPRAFSSLIGISTLENPHTIGRWENPHTLGRVFAIIGFPRKNGLNFKKPNIYGVP